MSRERPMTPDDAAGPASSPAAEPGAKQRTFGDAILDRLSEVPPTSEPPSTRPEERARAIATRAARKAGLISGLLALPAAVSPLTLAPDVYAIWNVQSQMVSDLAGAYGKTAWLTRKQMLTCLFMHGTVQAVRGAALRASQGMAHKRWPARFAHSTAAKLGWNVARHAVGHAVVRAVPVAGAMGVGTLAYFDTMRVARATISRLQAKETSTEGRQHEQDAK